VKTFFLFPLLLLSLSCQTPDGRSANPILAQLTQSKVNPNIDVDGKTIQERFTPPKGYQRSPAQAHSFPKYLQNLPLKPHGTPVKYYNGDTKVNNDVYCAVVDLAIGQKDLHQCADAIMRLRAEYLWKNKRYNEIHFNFTNGFRVDYSEWMKGRRMVVKGNKTYWNDRHAPSNGYDDFWKYMELIFMYAGTASLEQELKSVPITQAKIGDVLIRGGHPGHAEIIIDQVTNAQGKSLYLLAQSYMPAQELQVLVNPADTELSPWYELKEGQIVSPEWICSSGDLRRFVD